MHGGRVLDVGCGTGNLSERLAAAGLSVEGVDQSLEMLIQAKKKLPDMLLHQGTFLSLPFEKCSFDTITASYAFHHCDAQERLLACIPFRLKGSAARYDSISSGFSAFMRNMPPLMSVLSPDKNIMPLSMAFIPLFAR